MRRRIITRAGYAQQALRVWQQEQDSLREWFCVVTEILRMCKLFYEHSVHVGVCMLMLTICSFARSQPPAPPHLLLIGTGR